jgi:RNA polymerase sigma factor (sigma-70 family)
MELLSSLVDPSPPVPLDDADATADFESLRPRLWWIASRILGRAADADDVLQDVWIRWQRTGRTGIRDRTGFLVTVTTRVALNVVTAARNRREIPVGDRMPETDLAGGDPAAAVERTEALELAVRHLLERLSPVERAVFVLREAFDYPYRTIADSLGLSEPTARQVARRARVRLAGERRMSVDPAEGERLLAAIRIAGSGTSGGAALLERVLVATVREPVAA